MEENNKIIAEFIGLNSTNGCVRSETGKYYDYHASPKFSCIKEQEIQIESENGFGLVEQDFLFVEDLKFHSDWNWLMEVIEKILNICAENDDLEKYAVITDNIPYIQQTYDECIKFINFYNKQKEE